MQKENRSCQTLERGVPHPTVNLSDIDFPMFLEQHTELLLAVQVAHILETFDFSRAARFLEAQGHTVPVDGLKRDAEHALNKAAKDGGYRGKFLTAHRHGNWLELYVRAFSFDCSNPGPSFDLAVGLYSVVHRTEVIP